MNERPKPKETVPAEEIARVNSGLEELYTRYQRRILKPTWTGEIPNFQRTLTEFLRGEKNVTSPETSSVSKTRTYYLDLADAARGRKAGRLHYLEWSNSFLARVPVKAMPTKENPSFNQLAVTTWWLGNKNGEETDTIAEQLRSIASSHIVDLPQQLSERSIRDPHISKLEPDPRKVDRIKQSLEGLGKSFSQYDFENITIKLQRVWQSEGRFQFKPTLSVRTSHLVNNDWRLTIRGAGFLHDEMVLSMNEKPFNNLAENLWGVVCKAANIYAPGYK